MDDSDQFLISNARSLVECRRHLHRNPELSGQEHATTAWVATQLKQAGIPYQLGPEGRGIITGIQRDGRSKMPVIALRADMDALPIREENAVPYCSANAGVMHACGHDAHTTMLLYAMMALQNSRPKGVAWRGIFQPSEEVGHGARDMIKHGALDGVDAVIALHVDPNLYCGQIVVASGPQTAFCQDFKIIIRGKGGHAARPHQTVDPVAVAAQLVTLIYQSLPRQIDARDPLVVTIGQMQAGHATNVIPDTALLRGTVRTYSADVSTHARKSIDRLCKGTALAFGATIDGTFDAMLPGVINDPTVTAFCHRAAMALAGESHVITASSPSMGAEDFADYLTKVPGCMMRLGVRRKRKMITPLHTPTFDIDEAALPLGARLFTRVLHQWSA
ncbi:MAG: M20 family metallopeptidase [Verrucomicrobiota bacterium]